MKSFAHAEFPQRSPSKRSRLSPRYPPMIVRRLTHAALILALLVAGIPAPARAVSTQSEILQAKGSDKAVLEQYNVVTDPLLNQWVNGVGNKLWAQTARHDVPYNIKIIDSQDVNSFTIGGGYIYINEGALDFVQLDDELSGICGSGSGRRRRGAPVTVL